VTRRSADRCPWCGDSHPERPALEAPPELPRADRSRAMAPRARSARSVRAGPQDGRRVDRGSAAPQARHARVQPREDRCRLAAPPGAKLERDVAEQHEGRRSPASPLPHTDPQLSVRSALPANQAGRQRAVRRRPSCDWRERRVAGVVQRQAPAERRRVVRRQVARPRTVRLGPQACRGWESRRVRRRRWFAIRPRPHVLAGAPGRLRERAVEQRVYPPGRRAPDLVPCDGCRQADRPETTSRTWDSASSGRSMGHAARPPDREPCSPDIRP
jgi:hypothetical protein